MHEAYSIFTDAFFRQELAYSERVDTFYASSFEVGRYFRNKLQLTLNKEYIIL